jgi:outer membrane protein TolC
MGACWAAAAASGAWVPAAAAAQPLAAGGGPVSIERVVGLAGERNERARIASAQADAAAGRQQRARAFFFPELTVTGTYTRRLNETVRSVGDGQVTISRYNALSAQANLVVPLLDARLFPLYRQAKLERQSAELNAAEQRRLLGYEAADAFLMVLSQQQVAEAATRRLEFSRVALRDARARAAAGLVSSNDVTRGDLEAATAEREVSTARAQASTARLELGYLVDADLGGAALAAPDALLGDANRASAPPQEVIAAGLQRRLDLQAGQARVLALEAAAREPGLRIIPSFAAVAQYRITNEQGFSARQGDGFAGVVATWPLWDGGERAGESHERKALARAGAAEQDARVRAVALDVRRALVTLENAQSTQQVAARAADIARRNVQETAELYRQGLVRQLEVADANLRLFEAEVALARERYALALAYLDLRAAAGENPPGLNQDPSPALSRKRER